MKQKTGRYVPEAVTLSLLIFSILCFRFHYLPELAQMSGYEETY